MNRIETIRTNIRNRLEANKQSKKVEKAHRTNIHSNKYYGSKYWHILRSQYYASHPICEVCLKLGRIKSTDSIHHLTPFSFGETEKEKFDLLLDPNNLVSCCKKHHELFHELLRSMKRSRVEIDEVVQYDKLLNDQF